MSWKAHVKNAKHHLALGTKDIYLDDKALDALPWHLVTGCEDGGSRRLDISTSVHFRAKDPKSGLTFRWIFDIEERDANGKGYYVIRVTDIKDVMQRLPEKARTSFAAYLWTCAGKVREKAKEWDGWAKQQHQYADALQTASTTRK